MKKAIKPSIEYKKLQDKLHKLLDTPGGTASAAPLQDKLESVFMRTFFLAYIRSRRTYDIEQYLQGVLCGAYDHLSLYRIRYSSRAVVAVVQPYDPMPADAEQQLTRVGAELVDLNDWAFYYPGPNHASCYGIVINSKSEKLIKLVRTPDEISAEHVFLRETLALPRDILIKYL